MLPLVGVAEAAAELILPRRMAEMRVKVELAELVEAEEELAMDTEVVVEEAQETELRHLAAVVELVEK